MAPNLRAVCASGSPRVVTAYIRTCPACPERRRGGGVQWGDKREQCVIRTAEAVLAWIDRPERFARNKSIGSYFGMVPCQDQSADRNRLGHITKQGPAVVRRLLTEASWQSIRHSVRMKAYFEKVMRGDPDRRKIALVAVGHCLLRAMLSMLQTGEVWRRET